MLAKLLKLRQQQHFSAAGMEVVCHATQCVKDCKPRPNMKKYSMHGNAVQALLVSPHDFIVGLMSAVLQ